MKYDFDKVVDRHGTNCLKYDFAIERGKPADILPLWVADMDFQTAPAILERLKETVKHGIFGYSDGKEGYFAAVQNWYRERFGWETKPEWLVKTPGVVFALAAAVRAYTKEGDGVLLQQPVYYPFSEVITDNGRKIVNSPLKITDGYYTMDLDALETKIVENKVKLFLLCSPHNPVGRVWTRDEVERVVMLCRKYSVWLFSDEIHGDVALYGNQYTSAACFADVYDRMIVYTAISKTFNMAGLHSSCSIIPNPEYKKRQEASLREAWLMSPNCLSNAAIEACYTYGDEWVDQQNAYLTENAEFIIHYLAVHAPEIKPVKPEGTYLMWLDCSALEMTSDEIQKTLADHYGIAVGGGASYGGDGEHFLRFNFGCPRKTLEEGMEKLVQFVSDWRKGV